MQRNPQHSIIDPNLLDLNAYPLVPMYTADNSLDHDDIAIITGQAGYNDVDHSQAQMWSNLPNVPYSVDDFRTSEGLGFSPPQSQRNSSRVWSTEMLHVEQAGSSPSAGCGMGNHLQMCASGASWLTEPSHISSQFYQNDVLSRIPSGSQGSDTFFTPSWGSHHSSHTPEMHQRLPISPHQYHYQSTGSSCSDPQYDTAFEAIPDEFRRDCNAAVNLGQFKQEGTLLPSFSLEDGQTPDSSLTSAKTIPLAVPGRRTVQSPKNPGSYVNDIAMDSFHTDIPPSLADGSAPGLVSADASFLMANELSWQQQQASISKADCSYKPIIGLRQTPGSQIWSETRAWSPKSLSSTPYGSRINQDTFDSIPYGCSPITISASCERFDPHQTSSFPPTAGHFPEYMAADPNLSHQRATMSTSQPTIGTPREFSLPLRKQYGKGTTTSRSRSGSLRAIPEDACSSLASSPAGSIRGRRKGHLAPETALAAGQRRVDGTVCIRCKMMKQTCQYVQGNLSCKGCSKNSNANMWSQPCQKAKFLDMVEAGTCNAVFQQSSSFKSIRGKHRVVLSYPDRFDLITLFDSLIFRQYHYNISVRHFSGFSYTLDLSKLAVIMSDVKGLYATSTCKLDDFGKHKLSKASRWLGCILDDQTPSSAMGRLIRWNNMPSRNSYSFLPLSGASPRYMDAEKDEEREDILLAVHLCRIVLRALEVSAFRDLQKVINDLPNHKQSPTDMQALLRNLAELLFNLRWRISWWDVVGLSPSNQEDSREAYSERVTMLTQTLYLWYFVVKSKLPAWVLPASGGVSHVYADTTRAVLDDYPKNGSIEGFHAWMAHGRILIHQAQVVEGPLPQSLSQ